MSKYLRHMDKTPEKSRVAVIGLGLTGVGTLKNLLEEGFDATGFERNPWVGGLWRWSADERQTTALKSTRTNISKQRNCYQDFPFPKSIPDYATAEQLADYIQHYANHFELIKHCHLNTRVDKLEKSDSQWQLHYLDAQNKPKTELFDRVIVTTGTFHKPFIPEIEGIEKFQGQVIHAQAFKDPSTYTGQKVVLVGLSNTSADIAVDLSDTAEKVYISHRSGARIVSRGIKPTDHIITRRLTLIAHIANSVASNLISKFGTYFITRKIKKENPFIKSEWGLFPKNAPPITNQPPVMNDYLLSKFRDGSVESIPFIKRFQNHSIELNNGIIIPVDVVIFGTGYYFSYDILSTEADPTSFSTPEWDKHIHNNGLKYPRLYQGLLHPSYPETLAFIGPFRGHSLTAFSNADLSSQAISQLWKGNYPIPTEKEMNRWCDENYSMNLKQIQKWRISKVGQNPDKLERWLNKVTGNQVDEYILNWKSWKCWKFWWNDHEFYKMITDGIDTPYIYRLFPGRKGLNGESKSRKSWNGAKRAIYETNGKFLKD